MTFVKYFKVDNFDVLCSDETMGTKSSFTCDKSMVTSNDDRLDKSVCCNTVCKVFNISEVSSDSIADNDGGCEDFKGWKGFEGGR